jgi:hypothetical protein
VSRGKLGGSRQRHVYDRVALGLYSRAWYMIYILHYFEPTLCLRVDLNGRV